MRSIPQESGFGSFEVTLLDQREALTFAKGCTPLGFAWLWYRKEVSEELTVTTSEKQLRRIYDKLQELFGPIAIPPRTEEMSRSETPEQSVVRAVGRAVGLVEPFVVEPKPIIWSELAVELDSICDDLLPE